MNRSTGIISIAIILLFLLPRPAGKFLVNLTGGLILAILFIPVILTIIGWLGWKLIQSRMNTCEVCGAKYSLQFTHCPICGSGRNIAESVDNIKQRNIPASSATIDVSAEEAD